MVIVFSGTLSRCFMLPNGHGREGQQGRLKFSATLSSGAADDGAFPTR